MELYKRFTYSPVPYEINSVSDINLFISETLNREIENWVVKMQLKYKVFKYRLINAESFLDPRTKAELGIQHATAVIHIAYEIE